MVVFTTILLSFFFNDTATTEIYTLSLHDALPIFSLSGLKIPKIATPKFNDWGEIASWLGLENFPGSFPFTGGVFPFKREGEDPTRMFAGEGIAERTNRRFHLLACEIGRAHA